MATATLERPLTDLRVVTKAMPSWIPALLAALAIVLVLPLWIVKYPPILDYPNHLARWFVLAHIHDPHYRFNQLYSADWKPYPYILLDVLAVAMQRVVSIYLVGKLILTACVLSVPLSAWYFLRRANPENQYFALFAALIAYNPQFLMGSLQNELSTSICFLMLGLWITYTDHPTLKRWLALTLVVTLLYLTHLIGFAVAGIIVTAFAVLSRKSFKVIASSWAAFFPGFVLYAYSQHNLPHKAPLIIHYESISERIRGLAFPLRGYTRALDALAVAVLCVIVVWAFTRDRGTRQTRCWAGTAAILVALYFVVPTGVGSGGYVNFRILLFAFIVALAGIPKFTRREWVTTAAAALVVARCIDVSYHFELAQPQMRQLQAAISVVPSESRVLAVEAASNSDQSMFLRPIHVYAYGIVDRGWLTPSLFHLDGVQPIRVRSDIYCPNVFCGPLNDSEPDWQRVNQDYQIVWIYGSSEYLPDIERLGTRVFTDGKVSIYRMAGS